MGSKLQDDPRVDPRLKRAFGDLEPPKAPDVSNREELLAQERSPAAQAMYASMFKMMDAADTDDIAPRAGLEIFERRFRSDPNGNEVKVLIVKPERGISTAAVCYLHGGGMQMLSCFNGSYRAWARMIAAHGVTVVMVDFRNCVLPSSSTDVAPYPAGLNDCVSGLRWLHSQAIEFGLDPTRIILAGESGGANLAIASALRLKKDGELSKVKGIFALCPYIAGQWPQAQFPSSVENNRLPDDWTHNRARMAYGIEAFQARDPCAWPSFASESDVQGLPPTVISVNECDPFRDEGIAFYRLLLKAGVAARGVQNMGLTHGAQVFPLGVCLDASRDTARQIASFAKETPTSEVGR